VTAEHDAGIKWVRRRRGRGETEGIMDKEGDTNPGMERH